MTAEEFRFNLKVKRAATKADRALKYRTRRSQKMMFKSNSYNFFTVIFLVLFLLMFFSAVSGTDYNFTFTSFLESLSDSPTVDTSWIKTFNSLRISSDWDLFNFLRDFINTFMDIVSLLLWIVVGLSQLVVYIGYVFRVFFGGGA